MKDMKDMLALFACTVLAGALLATGLHVGLLKGEVHAAHGIPVWHLDAKGLYCLEQATQTPCMDFARNYFEAKQGR